MCRCGVIKYYLLFLGGVGVVLGEGRWKESELPGWADEPCKGCQLTRRRGTGSWSSSIRDESDQYFSMENRPTYHLWQVCEGLRNLGVKDYPRSLTKVTTGDMKLFHSKEGGSQ